MADILDVLGGAIYGERPNPAVQPYGVNPDGIQINKDGSPWSTPANVPPINPPTLVQRMFSPAAREAAHYNTMYQLMGPEATQRAIANESAQKLIANQRWGALTPQDQQAAGGDFNRAYTLNNGDFSSGNLEGTANNLADLQYKVPNARGVADFNSELARANTAKNIANKATVADLLDTPVKEASAEDIKAQNSGMIGYGENSLIPHELYNKGLGERNTTESLQSEYPLIGQRAGLESSRLVGEIAAQPALNSALLSQANVEQAMSGGIEANLSLSLISQRANALAEAYQAQHPAIYDVPGQGRIDPGAGLVYPGRYMSPDLRYAAGFMGTSPDALMGSPGGHTMPTGAVTRDGKSLPLPPSSVYTSQPAGVNPLGTGLLGNTGQHPMINGQETYNRQVHTPIVGTMYYHDEHGNVYDQNHQFVPEENYKGTPFEAVLKQQQKVNEKVQKAHEEQEKHYSGGSTNALIVHPTQKSLLGASIGGQDVSENSNYSAITPQQQLEKLGFVLDKNGQLQWQPAWYRMDLRQDDLQKNLPLAIKLAKMIQGQ